MRLLAALVVAVLVVVGCGKPEKDCWRGYKFDEEKQKMVKNKVWCDDCCRVCKQSKACGDGCISQSYDCHQPTGCACKRL